MEYAYMHVCVYVHVCVMRVGMCVYVCPYKCACVYVCVCVLCVRVCDNITG